MLSWPYPMCINSMDSEESTQPIKNYSKAFGNTQYYLIDIQSKQGPIHGTQSFMVIEGRFLIMVKFHKDPISP